MADFNKWLERLRQRAEAYRAQADNVYNEIWCKCYAQYVLRQIHSPRPVEELEGELVAREWLYETAAITAIGEVGRQAAVSDMVVILRGDP